MDTRRFVSKALAGLAGLGLFVPAIYAEEPTTLEAPAKVTRTVDVSLTKGSLTGRVLNAEGQPIDGATVRIHRGDRELARTTADSEGRFILPEIKPGVYLLRTDSTTQSIRVWDAASAPRSAESQATLIDGETIRGQFGPKPPTSSVGAAVAPVGFTAMSAAGLGFGGVAYLKVKKLEKRTP